MFLSRINRLFIFSHRYRLVDAFPAVFERRRKALGPNYYSGRQIILLVCMLLS